MRSPGSRGEEDRLRIPPEHRPTERIPLRRGQFGKTDEPVRGSIAPWSDLALDRVSRHVEVFLVVRSAAPVARASDPRPDRSRADAAIVPRAPGGRSRRGVEGGRGPRPASGPRRLRRAAGWADGRRRLLAGIGRHLGEIAQKPGIVSMWRTMRARISPSGSGPRRAAMLSLAWSGLVVAGSTQVTAGWEITHLRKNCAQVSAPISRAKSGSGRPSTIRNRAPSLERHVDQHRDAAVGRRLEDALLGLPGVDRVVDLGRCRSRRARPTAPRPGSTAVRGGSRRRSGCAPPASRR